MHEVKVGQEYRYEGRAWGSVQGTLTTVTGISGERISIDPGTWDIRELFFATEADFISSYKAMGYVLVKDVEEPVEEENNQLSPNVYQFPNGVEVKDISAHLTSFGGQAVQYIARATRLDGVVKGLPIQDLYKAIELLKWEAERLEALQK